jgi:hypothetical protein
VNPASTANRVIPAQESVQLECLSWPAIDVQSFSQCYTPRLVSYQDSPFSAEASATLHASVSEACVHHAVDSLCCFYKSFQQQCGNWSVRQFGGPSTQKLQNPSSFFGLRQYHTAVKILAHKLSNKNNSYLQPTLLCCQIFICIEIFQQNFGAAIQHFIRGLRIMQYYRLRPVLDEKLGLLGAKYKNVPHVDTFLLKFWTVPKFNPNREYQAMVKMLMSQPSSVHGSDVIDCEDLDTIMREAYPQMFKGARDALIILDAIVNITSRNDVLAILEKRASFLSFLQDWHSNVEALIAGRATLLNNPVTTFAFLLHSLLKVILTMSFVTSQKIKDEIELEFEILVSIAEQLDSQRQELRRLGNEKSKSQNKTQVA